MQAAPGIQRQLGHYCPAGGLTPLPVTGRQGAIQPTVLIPLLNANQAVISSNAPRVVQITDEAEHRHLTILHLSTAELIALHRQPSL